MATADIVRAPLAAHNGDYGYDAPYALLGFAVAAVVSIVLFIAGLRLHERSLIRVGTIYGAVFVLFTVSFWYTTRRGKFVEWARVLAGLGIRGDERVLDLGCGRGAVLTMVARCLTSGRATGIDIWNTTDQSGSSASRCRENAAREGIADRITLATADMRALPFAAGSVDLVVSSLAIHNIRLAADRAQALAEAVLVLAPGGRLAIADIKHTRSYAKELSRLGLLDVTRRSLGWRFWYGNPIAATSLVTGRKPVPVASLQLPATSVRLPASS